MSQDGAVASFNRTTRLALRGALIVVATFCILRGIGYSPLFGPDRLPDGVALIAAFVPIQVWAWMWVGAGAIALALIGPCWPAGSLGCVAMCLVWAVGYTVSFSMAIHLRWWHLSGFTIPYLWVDRNAPSERDYLSASVYWTVLLLLGCGYILAYNALRLGKGTRTPTST